MKVIENEFTNKEYIREYPFTKYSLDFAWPKLKKCIEIDGEQHERFQDYKNRDILKDKLLIENGWQVLRLPWKEVFNNTKYYIKVAKDFIENK
jgi:very-short-patch-repair endonuclease